MYCPRCEAMVRDLHLALSVATLKAVSQFNPLLLTSFSTVLFHVSLGHQPPRWPSGYVVRLKSGKSRVRIPLALGFFRDGVIPVT